MNALMSQDGGRGEEGRPREYETRRTRQRAPPYLGELDLDGDRDRSHLPWPVCNEEAEARGVNFALDSQLTQFFYYRNDT